VSSPIRQPAASTRPAKVPRPKLPGQLHSGPTPARVQIAPAAAPAPAGTGSTAPVLLPLAELVLDPALQCRVGGTHEDKIAEYAELLADGAELGALRVVTVDGVHLVVDGFHRHRAALRAGLTVFPCRVLVGTRRDALLAAARANDDHGIPRSDGDKRNAVRLLLMDAEWCALSSRPLAELAGVSHRLVNRVRSHYGVAVGEALTAERAAAADAWAELLASAKAWERSAIERIRKAAGPAELVAVGFLNEQSRAHALRRRELAFRPWPWQDRSPAAMHARAHRLDTYEDIIAALGAADCPKMDELYQVLNDMRLLKQGGINLDNIERRWRGRPRLEVILAERKAVVAAEKARQEAESPYHIAVAIQQIADPTEQAERIKSAPAGAITYLHGPKLHPAVRDGVFRERAAPRSTVQCADPRCGGWARDVSSTCSTCGLNVGMRRDTLRKAESDIGGLVRSGAYGLPVGEVLVDAVSVDLLAALTTAVSEGRTSWIGEAPPELARALRLWTARPAPPRLPDPDASLAMADGDEGAGDDDEDLDDDDDDDLEDEEEEEEEEEE